MRSIAKREVEKGNETKSTDKRRKEGTVDDVALIQLRYCESPMEEEEEEEEEEAVVAAATPQPCSVFLPPPHGDEFPMEGVDQCDLIPLGEKVDTPCTILALTGPDSSNNAGLEEGLGGLRRRWNLTPVSMMKMEEEGWQRAHAPLPVDWAKRRRSPRASARMATTKGRVKEEEDKLVVPVEQLPSSSMVSTRSSSKSRRDASLILPDTNLRPNGDWGGNNRRARRVTKHPRLLKHNPIHMATSNPRIAPVVALLPLPTRSAPHQSSPEQLLASRREFSASSFDTGTPINSEGSMEWLQFIEDVVMWKNIPRSSFIFGAGCFSILSGSVMDIWHSLISIISYTSLFFLAVVFFRHTLYQRGNPRFNSPSFIISESDVLELARLILPLVNGVLSKISRLFSGEPVMTLKVAISLWLLAKAGHYMSLWTIVCFAYFAVFIIPKCYTQYHIQLNQFANSLRENICITWNALHHKKAVLFGAFVLAWNFSSISARLYAGFIAIVSLRLYLLLQRSEQDN